MNKVLFWLVHGQIIASVGICAFGIVAVVVDMLKLLN